MRPCDCETLADVLSLNKSYERSGRFDILVQHDGAVILTDHVPGEKQKASIVIPRRNFLRLIEFFQSEQ